MSAGDDDDGVAVDESALAAVSKTLAARRRTVGAPRYVGWLDKINARDRKVLKRVVVVTGSHVLSCKPDGRVAREGKLSEVRSRNAPLARRRQRSTDCPHAWSLPASIVALCRHWRS